MSQTERTISRRTVARGVAWATPAIVVVGAAPVAAASTTLPPCIAGIANTSIEWAVDNVRYDAPNCSTCASHMDARLKITISPCQYRRVQVRVTSISGNSKWCWTGTSDWLTKTANISESLVVTYPNQVLTTGGTSNDGLYFPAYSTDGVRDDLGSCLGDTYVGTNDGMHINPCSSGPYFRYQTRYSEQTTGGSWTDWTPEADWGYAADVPKPPGCGPALLSATNNQQTCPTGDRTIALTWNGSTTKIQYRVAQEGGSFSGDWTNQNDNSSPGTITLSGGSKCRAVQVRLCNGGSDQNCTIPSATLLVPAVGAGFVNEGPNHGQPEPSTQTLSESSTESVTDPGAESLTESSSTDSSSTETGGDASSSESTDK